MRTIADGALATETLSSMASSTRSAELPVKRVHVRTLSGCDGYKYTYQPPRPMSMRVLVGTCTRAVRARRGRPRVMLMPP